MVKQWIKTNLQLNRVSQSTQTAVIGTWKLTIIEVKDNNVRSTHIIFSDLKNGTHIVSYEARGMIATKEFIGEKVEQFLNSAKLDDYMVYASKINVI